MKSAPARTTPFALLSWALYPGPGAVAGLVSLLIAVWICELSIPLLLGATVDAAVSRTGSSAAIIRYGAAACAVAALLYVLHCAYLRAEARCVATGTYRLRRYLYTSVLEQSLSGLSRARTGEVAQRLMSDTEVLDTHVIYLLADAPFCAATVLGIFAVMEWMQPALALLVSAMLLAVAILSNRAARPLPTMERLVRHRWARLGGRLQEILDGFRTVKLFGGEMHETAQLDRGGKYLMRSEIALGKAVAQLEPLLQLTTTVGLLVVVCYGSLLVFRGALSPGGLVAFIAYMELMCEPVRDAGAHLAHYRQSVGTLARVSEFLRQLAPSLPGGKSAISGPFEVEVEDIRFTYPGGSSAVVDGISFRAAPGEIIAIAGDNGAGKSTLMDILLGLLPPDRGCVRTGAIRLEEWDRTVWRAATAVVPQIPFLFRATIEDNIRYGSPGATMEEVESAVEQAGLADLVARLPCGLATLVGNDGDRLSGGERQRVALARAFLRNPRLLVLDEPTSALDPAALPNLGRALRENRTGRVTFVISHDRRAIAIADRVIVLKRGRIAFVCDASQPDKLNRIFAEFVPSAA